MKLFSQILFLVVLFMQLPELKSNGYNPDDEAHSITKAKNDNSGKIHLLTSRSCASCHVPIDISFSASAKPEWINEESESYFEIYTSNSTISGYPNSSSKLCLSCHDGTFAVEDESIYQNSSQKTLFTGISGNSDHPVSIEYNSELAMQNNRLADPSITASGLGGTIEDDLLVNGKIECTTCHDVHKVNDENFSMNNHFNKNSTMISASLKITNINSTLCLTCHLM